MTWSSGSGVGATALSNLINATSSMALADTYYAALYTSSGTPPAGATNLVYSTTGEVSGTGYTAGGASIGSLTAAYNATGPVVVFSVSSGSVSWTTSTLSSVVGTMVYDHTTSHGTNVIAWMYFASGPYSSSAGTFQVTWSASPVTGGIFDITGVV